MEDKPEAWDILGVILSSILVTIELVEPDSESALGAAGSICDSPRPPLACGAATSWVFPLTMLSDEGAEIWGGCDGAEDRPGIDAAGAW